MRYWLLILVVLSLAACSSAPPRAVRSGGATPGENAWRTMPPGSPRFVDHSTGREEISIEAMGLIGIPYRWGGNTPDSGFDCSGLVRYVVARAADVDLPRTTADMSRRGESIEPDEIAPGDLIFFNTTGRPHSHVGIYVGKLRFVNAPSTGGTVRLDYLTNPYWARHFDGIRRVAAPLKPKSPFDAPTELAGHNAPAVPDTPIEPRQAPVATNNAEDPIAAAADAFEPPPPIARQAAQQAQQAGALSVQPMPTESNAQTTRASAAPGTQEPAPSSTSDDPIARFANNGD